MWEYNYSDPYEYDEELMHYGVKGMRWGHRKKYYNEDGSLNARGQARQDYKDARKATRQARKEFRRAGYTAIGMKGLSKYKKAEKKANDAALRELDAKAKYNASKAKNKEKADKAELKTYTKAMYKTGLPGSAADDASKGTSTRLYNSLKAKKGKAYADKVVKKAQDKAVTQIAVGTTMMVGSAFAMAYLENNY